MSALRRIWNRLFGRHTAARRADRSGPGRPSARFDAAVTGDPESRNHWAAADGLSPNAAITADVRYRLRNRSRYECANNGYAAGLVRARADAVVGVCPSLQLTLPETVEDPDFEVTRPVSPGAERAVEILWRTWADRIGLADKLRLMVMAELRDGESFAVAYSNPQLAEDGVLIGATTVTLDLRVYEAEMCATPDIDPTDPAAVDGIVLDENGNPIEYHFLDAHPGDIGPWAWGAAVQSYTAIPARQVIHLYDPDRAQQYRGIPGLTPALPLYAILRRYTLAGLLTAEHGASIAGVIESNLPPDADSPPIGVEPLEEIEAPRNRLLTLPEGHTAKGFEAKQPAPGYREFKHEVLTEAGRSVVAPRNVSTGSSADYNYSSGRLDLIPEQRRCQVIRDRLRRLVLDRVFRWWLAEARRIPGYLPEGLPPVEQWRWRWRWDGFGAIDPVREAKAASIRLEAGLTDLVRECAENGDDWEEVLENQARVMRRRMELGLPEKDSAKTTISIQDEDGSDPTVDQPAASAVEARGRSRRGLR